MIIDVFFVVCFILVVFAIGLFVGYLAGFSSEFRTG